MKIVIYIIHICYLAVHSISIELRGSFYDLDKMNSYNFKFYLIKTLFVKTLDFQLRRFNFQISEKLVTFKILDILFVAAKIRLFYVDKYFILD